VEAPVLVKFAKSAYIGLCANLVCPIYNVFGTGILEMFLPHPTPQPPKGSYKKIRETLLFVMSAAHARGYVPTQYDLVKALFIADFHHMNRYGRPVTFDSHVAMEHGPVPTAAYNMLKPQFNWALIFGDNRAPFNMRASKRGPADVYEYFETFSKPDLNLLSKSDQEELESALSYVIEKGFFGVRDWTHDLEAYKSAWAERGDKRSTPMDTRLLLESGDKKEAEAIAFASHHLA